MAVLPEQNVPLNYDDSTGEFSYGNSPGPQSNINKILQDLAPEKRLADNKKAMLANRAVQKKAKIGNVDPKRGWQDNLSVQENIGNLMRYQLRTGDDGKLYEPTYTYDKDGNEIETLVPYNQKYARNMYMDDTVEGNMKLGLGDYSSRYNPNDPKSIAITNSDAWRNAQYKAGEKRHDGSLAIPGEYKNRVGGTPDGAVKPYGWEPGPKGITYGDGPLLNTSLPYDLATEAEYKTHSNPDMIKNRAVGQGPVSAQEAADFGPGKTEYYTPNSPLMNADYRGDGSQVLPGTPVPQRPDWDKYKQQPQQQQQQSFVDKLYGSSGTGEATDSDGQFGETVDAIQSGLLQTYGKANTMLRNASRAGGRRILDFINPEGEESGENREAINKFLPTTDKVGTIGFDETTSKDLAEQNIADKITGVNPESRARQQRLNLEAAAYSKAADDDWEKGDKLGFATNTARQIIANVKNSPMMIGDSAGETAGIMVNTIGTPLIVGTRVDQQMDEFKKNNGRDMTKEEIALTSGLNALSLYGEKLLIKTGAGKVIKGILGKSSLGNKMLDIIGSGAGEYTQERFDQAVEKFSTRDLSKDGDRSAVEVFKDIWNSKEVRDAGVAGMTMGATLQAGGEAVSATKELAKVGLKGADKLVENIADSRTNQAKTKAKEQLNKVSDEAIKDSVKAIEPNIDNKVNVTSKDAINVAKENIEGYDDLDSETKKAVKDAIHIRMNEAASVKESVETESAKEVAKDIDDETVASVKKQTAESLDKKIEDVTNDEIVDFVKEKTNDNLSPRAFKIKLNENTKQETKKTKDVDPDVSSRAEAAGFTESYQEDLDNRLEDVSVELDEDVSPRAKTSKKQTRFDPARISDDMMSDIASGSFSTKEIENVLNSKEDTRLLSRLSRKLGFTSTSRDAIKNIQKSLNSKFNNNKKVQEKFNSLFSGDKDKTNTAGKLARMLAIASSVVESSMTSEFDINEREGYQSDSKKPYARASQVDQQIGKEYLNSYGIKLTGSKENIGKEYNRIGKQIRDILTDLDIFESGTQNLLAPNVVFDKDFLNKKPIEGKKHGSSAVTEKDYLALGYPVSKNRDDKLIYPGEVVYFKDSKNKSTDRIVQSNVARNFSLLNRLLHTTNYEVPLESPTNIVTADRLLTNDHLKIIQDYQELPYDISADQIELLKELKDLMSNFESYDQASKDKRVQAILGVEKTGVAINETTEQGQEMDRFRRLWELLDNLENLEEQNDLYFNYKSAINQRIHVMQTILDYQGDKWMARQILTSGEYTTKGTEDSKLLMENVADEIYTDMFTEEQIDAVEATDTEDETDFEARYEALKDGLLNPTDKVKRYFDIIDKYGKLSLDDAIAATEEFGIGSVFKTLKYINGWHDVYKAKDKNKITTDYMPEFDATASGVMNTLLNLSGFPAVQKVLEGMGVIGSSKKFIDPYKWLAKTVQNKADKLSKEFNETMSSLEDIRINFREVSKYAVMPWFYGQSDENTKTSMARDISMKVANKAIRYNQSAIDLINKILDKNYVVESTKENAEYISDLTKEDLSKLDEYFKEHVAEVYVTNLNEAFPMVKRYRTVMS